MISDLDNKQFPSVIVSGLSIKEDTASPTVRSISLLSSRAVKNMQKTLAALQKMTARQIGRLKTSWHFSSTFWLRQ